MLAIRSGPGRWGCGGGGGGHKTSPTAASLTVVSGDQQSGVAGSALPTALGVSVKARSGRAVAGVSVSWSVVAGGGSVTPGTSTTDSGGLATTNWTLGAAPGANQVTATVAGLAPVTLNAMAVAGATARDAAGNVLPGKQATWSSGNPQSFPLSASGELKTWGTGAVTVAASIDGISGSLPLTIVPIEVKVTLGAKETVFDWSNDRCMATS